ncbi:MAG: hypothetical protein HZA88_10445 [Verrucomicrobia bacterium]|nr:hypothetical protein [Verrucomicrobiota bacterium]
MCADDSGKKSKAPLVVQQPSPSPATAKAAKWPVRLLIALACLVVLFALFHVEENWRGERDWLAYKQQMEARGEKLDLASYIPPRVPDDQNFAMTPFLAPLFNFDPATGQPRKTEALKRTQSFADSLPIGGPSGRAIGRCTDLVAWKEAMQKPVDKDNPITVRQKARTTQERAAAAPAVLAALKQYEPVIEELRAASQRPHCRFNLPYEAENPMMIQTPSSGTFMTVCRVVALRASAELALGQTEQALADLKLVFHIADTTQNDFLTGYLVATTERDTALQLVWEGLANHQWSDAQLQTLQAKLQSMDCLRHSYRALKVEQAFSGNAIFDYLKKQAPGEVLNTLLFTSAFTSLETETRSPWSVVICHMAPRGWIQFEQLNYNRCFEEQLFPVFDMAARRIYPQRARQSEQAFTETGISCVWRHRVMTQMLLPVVASIARRSASAQTSADEAALACALERYRLANGRFPDSLTALAPAFITKLPHDIITGEPLKYRKDGDGFVLYSVGWNEKDDGGVTGNWRDFEQGDWVWQCPAKK